MDEILFSPEELAKFADPQLLTQQSAITEPAPRRMHPALAALMYGGIGADALTTAIARGMGAREANPLMPQNIGAIMGIKGAEGLLGYLLQKKVAPKNPKGANIAAAILGGVSGAAALSNMGQIGKQKKINEGQ